MSLTDTQKKELILQATGFFNDDEIDDINLDDYMVLTDDEADEALLDYVRKSIWAFNASFLASYLGCPVEAVEAVQSNDKCEDNNKVFLEWLENTDNTLEDFAQDAGDIDGRGHFISNYDGGEYEAEIDGTYYYIYRTN